MIRKLLNFALYHRCYWCEFPQPDCVCAISRMNSYGISKPANDNEKRLAS